MRDARADVGVVLCDCGGRLRKRLDFERLQKHLARLHTVATVRLSSKFCQQNECNKLIKSIAKTRAKRLVIAACDQEVYNKNLCKAMASEKLNRGLLWCTNIREHCAWVTSKPKKATDKAIEIISAAVQRVGLSESVKSKKIRVNQNVLVVGGGVAAMQAAAGSSQLGHRVTLVYKGDKLGGLVAKSPELYAYVASDFSDARSLVQARVDELIKQVSLDKQVGIETNAFLKSVEGQFGDFTAIIDSGGTEKVIFAGAIILATGATSSPLPVELAPFIHNGQDIPKRVAIVIDTLGEQGRAVSAQVLSAAELLVKRFAVEVKLYCHNIRVSSIGLESLYRRARESGVVVVKYESPPTIVDKGATKLVRVEEPIIGVEISEEFDVVIRADASAVHGGNELLALIKGLRPNTDGALQYDSVWLLPTKTNREGIFVAGSARSDSELRDAQADGLAAANQIHELLKDKQIEVLDDAAVVDSDKCVLCLTCMRICPYYAVSIDVDNKTASISAVTCKRCGICATQCPAGAIQLPRYTDEQVKADIGGKPRITIFACENSAYPAATAAAVNGFEYNSDIQLIRVPCAGKVDARQVLQALESGAEKVLILSCHPENCQYLDGSSRAKKRIDRLNNTLEKASFDSRRVLFRPLASVEPAKFLEYVKE